MDIARTRREAEPRVAESPFRLGRCFDGGDRAAEGIPDAGGFCRGAADLGDVLAPFSLGSCYFNGTREMLAPLEVVLWCREAAEHGVAEDRNGVRQLDRAGDGASAIASPHTSEGAATVSEGPLNDVDPARASRARSWAEF